MGGAAQLTGLRHPPGALISDGLSRPDDTSDPLWAHLLIESARAAGHDRLAVLADGADVAPLLQPDAVAQRRLGVDPNARALLGAPTADGGTIHLCAVDGDGMGVSLIQSNASGFGAHLVVPGVRIFLQNRGIGFSLVAWHSAEYGPRRRPPDTLSPVLVTRPSGELRALLGAMGGDTQPQILLQLLTRLLRHGESPGATIAAGRWALHNPRATGFDTWADPDAVTVILEGHVPPAWPEGLRDRGHEVHLVPAGHGFGHAQLIDFGQDGMRAGASDPRANVGAAVGH